MMDLLHGDIELWKAYWLLFAGGTFFLSLVEIWVAKKTNKPWILLAVSFMLRSYIIIVGIGVWSSANNYIGTVFWAYAAKFVVVIAVLRSFILIIMGIWGLIYMARTDSYDIVYTDTHEESTKILDSSSKEAKPQKRFKTVNQLLYIFIPILVIVGIYLMPFSIDKMINKSIYSNQNKTNTNIERSAEEIKKVKQLNQISGSNQKQTRKKTREVKGANKKNIKQFSLAVTYYKKKKYRQAKKIFQELCLGGNGTSCSIIGQMFESGTGVAKDNQAATKYYSLAIKNGHTQGFGLLGNMYYRGKGVKKSYKEAMRLFFVGCSRDDGYSCGMFGYAFATGTWLKKDYSNSIKYLKKGCKLGNNMSCVLLKNITDIKQKENTPKKTYRILGIAKGSFLNIRSGPSLKYKKVGRIKHDANKLIIETCTAGWCKIDSGGRFAKGWVSKKFLKEQQQ